MWLVAAALGMSIVACSSEGDGARPRLASGPPSGSTSRAAPSQPARIPAATIPVIAGVSQACAAAVAAFDGYLDPVMLACSTLEELETAGLRLGTGRYWEADVVTFCAYEAASASICATIPTPEPTAVPMTSERAREMCESARPARVYRVTAAMKPLEDAGGPFRVHVLLVELRDLEGKVRTTANLKDEGFYEFAPFTHGESSTGEEIELVVCVALQATDLEFWHYTHSPTIDYPIHASDAIVWAATASDGRRLGSPWVLHPPESGSGDNFIYIGADGPGQRPPPESQIIETVDAFLGE